MIRGLTIRWSERRASAASLTLRMLFKHAKVGKGALAISGIKPQLSSIMTRAEVVRINGQRTIDALQRRGFIAGCGFYERTLAPVRRRCLFE